MGGGRLVRKGSDGFGGHIKGHSMKWGNKALRVYSQKGRKTGSVGKGSVDKHNDT